MFTSSNTIVLKTQQHTVFTFSNINKVLCTINAENIAKLLSRVNLTANPRESKKNKVTTAIIETLSLAPTEMVNRTKGLLVSTHKCKPLERGRFELSFEDEKTDGVLDGGHNLLAIGCFLLEQYYESLGEVPSAITKISCWDSFNKVWFQHINDKNIFPNLMNFINTQEFLVPVEIIYPNNDKLDFAEIVFEISDARNNNSPLTAGTKADHKGHYDTLKSFLDPELADLVAWKDNEPGKRIKREDIVALSLIPLIALQRKGLLKDNISTINPMLIYSSKAKCTEIFSEIFDEHKQNPSAAITNALRLMKDIPKLHDLVYLHFPHAYNSYSPGFGRISSVKKIPEGSKKALSKFYRYESDYKYPDGFIIPFISSLHTLIDIKDDGHVSWKVNIEDFIKNDSLYRMLVSTIKDNHFEPNSVGKSGAAYEGSEISLKMGLIEQ